MSHSISQLIRTCGGDGFPILPRAVSSAALLARQLVSGEGLLAGAGFARRPFRFIAEVLPPGVPPPLVQFAQTAVVPSLESTCAARRAIASTAIGTGSHPCSAPPSPSFGACPSPCSRPQCGSIQRLRLQESGSPPCRRRRVVLPYSESYSACSPPPFETNQHGWMPAQTGSRWRPNILS